MTNNTGRLIVKNQHGVAVECGLIPDLWHIAMNLPEPQQTAVLEAWNQAHAMQDALQKIGATMIDPPAGKPATDEPPVTITSDYFTTTNRKSVLTRAEGRRIELFVKDYLKETDRLVWVADELGLDNGHPQVDAVDLALHTMALEDFD